jgi:hypothetical protein
MKPEALLELVKRTRHNLEATDSWRKEHPDDEFYEVTHLINSLSGLIRSG